MKYPILTMRLTAHGLVPLRARARQVGELFGLDPMQRTRFITALSEIARNAVQYAGEGTVIFVLDAGDGKAGQELLAEVRDLGPGIDDLKAILAGRLNARQQVPTGIAGARRLVDRLDFESPPEGGTAATVGMVLPRQRAPIGVPQIPGLVDQLMRRKAQTPLEEMDQQNREMMEALHELRGRQQELKLADERKNQFLATLAHELRNPLGTMRLTLEIMRRQASMEPDKLAERRETMGRQVSQMSRLVDDLMDVSRITLGKVELHKEVADVNVLARDALEMTESAIVAKGHTVSFRGSETPLGVAADATRMRQVFGNLIHNSARYTPAGGEIGVSVRQEQSYAVIDVTDNGVGIPQEALGSVFGLFVQGAHAPDAKGGLGVGLTLVQRLVEAHGGTVSASSAGVGCGSRFTVSLPLVAMPAG